MCPAESLGGFRYVLMCPAESVGGFRYVLMCPAESLGGFRYVLMCPAESLGGFRYVLMCPAESLGWLPLRFDACVLSATQERRANARQPGGRQRTDRGQETQQCAHLDRILDRTRIGERGGGYE